MRQWHICTSIRTRPTTFNKIQKWRDVHFQRQAHKKPRISQKDVRILQILFRPLVRK